MRNILVTGASRGLGLAIAQTLAARGWRVIATARSEGRELGAVRQSAKAGPGAIEFRALDLAETAAFPGFIKAVRNEFGGLYGLANNAGLGTAGLLANMREAEIDRLLHINTRVPLLLSKYAVRAMLAGGEGGRIVSIASIIAGTGYNGLSVYAASKAAMIGFTRSLAREVGPAGITVNAVAPGFIDTEMTGGLKGEDRARVIRRAALRRLAEPADVAEAVAYLVSDTARNVTGTVLTVDAGSTA